MDRRHFLGWAAAAPAVAWVDRLPAAAAAATASPYQRLLVLVELKGGNDGLNSVVPYTDETYYRLRPRLAIPRDQVLQLDERAGFHPALAALMPSWQQRELAVVQSVHYPTANLSHFRSIEIWETASRSNEYLGEGWLARLLAERPAPRTFAADGMVIGGNDLGPLAGGSTRTVALADTEQFVRQARLAAPSGVARNASLAHILRVEQDIVDAAARLGGRHAFRSEFPRTPFGQAVQTAASVAAGSAGVAVLKLGLGSFDTHANQPTPHANLLRQLAEGLAALRSALIEINRWDSTLVMTYAEFGRRPRENQSNGTDHGTASAHFLLGGRVQGGLHGLPPALDRLDGNGNLPFAVDFRDMYATVIERWWGLDAATALRGRFRPLDVLRA